MQKNFLFAIIFSLIFLLFSNTFTNKNTAPQQHVNSEIESEENEIGDLPDLEIKSKVFEGKINLKGLKITKTKLLEYKESVGSTKNVEILTDTESKNQCFVNFGFTGSGLHLPNRKTTWTPDHYTLTETTPVTLTWTNDDGLIFKIHLSIKSDYLISAKMTVDNQTKNTYDISGYALINKSYNSSELTSNNISHEGMTGVINEKLEEYSYSTLKDDKEKVISDTKIDWFGISDKYWMIAVIPSKERLYNLGMQYDFIKQKDKIQLDITTKKLKLEPQSNIEINYDLFLGPKKFQILEEYKYKSDIKLFDRAIDFGWLYPITKPIFLLLNYLNRYIGNFGISILVLTFLIKTLMFGITNKANKSMQAIKRIQPEIENLKTKYANDKLQLNKEILHLYKIHKVNPFMGLVSMLVQVPIFFGIYKVLYVTIEMRHAPFIWWIKDLSAPDPTNIFNLFGLLNYNIPSYLHLGALPIMMSATMYVQQLFMPAQDPVQAKIMKFLPLIFLFTFSNFPAGLLIYWTFSNLIEITQKLIIRHDKL